MQVFLHVLVDRWSVGSNFGFYWSLVQKMKTQQHYLDISFVGCTPRSSVHESRHVAVWPSYRGTIDVPNNLTGIYISISSSLYQVKELTAQGHLLGLRKTQIKTRAFAIFAKLLFKFDITK